MAKIRETTLNEAKLEEAQFRGVLPTTGFFYEYMKYTDRQESPGSFHFWVGAAVISATIGRQVWLPKGIYNVYPNIYTVLVAPSGRCRKSRAVDLGVDLVSDLPFVNMIADKTTPEALLQALAVGTKAMEQQTTTPTGTPVLDNTGFVKAGELSVFIDKQTYTSGMVSLLTTLYDSPPTFKYLTRNKSPVSLKNVTLQLLGASTPEWLASSLPEHAFAGGFMSRMIFMVKFVRDRSVTFPEDPPDQERVFLQKMLIDLHSKCVGPMTLEPDAKVWFEAWYRSNDLVIPDDPTMGGFFERKPDTLLKVAIILAAAEQRMQITTGDLQLSHMIVSWTQERMFRAFEHVDLSPLGNIQRQILESLKLSGELTRSTILRQFGGKLPAGIGDLEKIESLLVQAGLIELVEAVPKKKNQRRILFWRYIGEQDSEQKGDDPTWQHQ